MAIHTQEHTQTHTHTLIFYHSHTGRDPASILFTQTLFLFFFFFFLLFTTTLEHNRVGCGVRHLELLCFMVTHSERKLIDCVKNMDVTLCQLRNAGLGAGKNVYFLLVLLENVSS